PVPPRPRHKGAFFDDFDARGPRRQGGRVRFCARPSRGWPVMTSTQPGVDRQPRALETALQLFAEGLWPVAIHAIDSKETTSPGKAPIGNAWGTNRPTAKGLKATFDRYPRAGVGLKLGAEGGVIDVDVDDPEQARVALARIFPDGLPPTRGWQNAGGKFH